MPCEYIPSIVNKSCIAVEPRAHKLEQSVMHEEKGKHEEEKIIHWSAKTDFERIRYQLRERRGLRYGGTFEGHSEMFHNDAKFRDCRTLSRDLPKLKKFGIIEEVESTAPKSDQLGEATTWFSRPPLQHCCESPRRKGITSSCWPMEAPFTGKQRSQDFSQYRINRRRQSEGALASGRKTFGLVGYKNKNESFESILSCEQRSGNPNIIGLLERESVDKNDITTQDFSVSSFEIMSSLGAVLHRPKSYSLPRKLSMPAQSVQYDVPRIENQQRISVPTDDPNCLQKYSFDNDTEVQWENLVTRAKNLQFNLPKRPDIISSGLSYENRKQVQRKTTESTGDHHENGVDNRVKDEKMYEADTTVGKENNNETKTTRRRRKSDEKRYSLKLIVNGVESSDERQNMKFTSDKLSTKIIKQPGIPVIDEQRAITDGNNNEQRRHSVAVMRPTQQLSEKVSGYSTHGALEYAKMLLGKIQEEGKTKTKKERLEEMSKVLKLVLEELNRIELPDRDLVSIFISLRAKIVNLKDELKADEGEKSKDMDKEKDEDNNDRLISKTNLLRPRAGSHEEITTSVHSRRFSWC